MVALPILIRLTSKADQRLASPHNYLRFFLHELLPDIDKILYLDTDVVVLADVAELSKNILLVTSQQLLQLVGDNP